FLGVDCVMGRGSRRGFRQDLPRPRDAAVDYAHRIILQTIASDQLRRKQILLCRRLRRFSPASQHLRRESWLVLTSPVSIPCPALQQKEEAGELVSGLPGGKVLEGRRSTSVEQVRGWPRRGTAKEQVQLELELPVIGAIVAVPQRQADRRAHRCPLGEFERR